MAISTPSRPETPRSARRRRPVREDTAVATPMGKAPIAARRKDATARVSVTGKRCAIVSATGRCDPIAVPKSPRNSPLT